MSTAQLLPPGAVLLHIGPYKTGSTSIQRALHQKRGVLRKQGVIYPGRSQRQRRPGWAVLEHTPRGRQVAHIDEWRALVRQVADVGSARVCISTEDFGRATAAQAARIVHDLGPERVHVVAVARRIDHLLPSQWQERIKTCHETKSYADWLESVLGDDRKEPSARAFWASHDLARMLANWTKVVPPGQFHLVVTDDSDRGLLARSFEQLLGLSAGLLDLPSAANSSLTEEKIELIRELNTVFERNRWSDRLHMYAVQEGVKAALLRAPKSQYDQKIPALPRWASERISTLSDERVAAVKAFGVNVIGDLECLRTPAPVDADAAAGEPAVVSIDAAKLALTGAISGAVKLIAENDKRHRAELARARSGRRADGDDTAATTGPRSTRPTAYAPTLDSASGVELLGATARRAAETLRDRLGSKLRDR